MKGKRSRTIPAEIGRSLRWMVVALALAVMPTMAQDAQAPGPAEAAPGGSAVSDAVKALRRTMLGKGSTQPPEPTDEADSDSKQPDTQVTPESEPPDIHVSPEGRVEMHVRALDLATVLQMLSMQSRRNIIASQSVSGTVTANLYNVTFEEALTAILASNGCSWREERNFICVYTLAELKEMAAAARQVTSRLFRLYYTKAADVQTMIQPLLSEVGKASVTPVAKTGVAASSEEAGGNDLPIEDCLLVLDYPERIDTIAKLIAEIDVRPRQVLIEATILSAELNERNMLGIDFNLVGGVDFENLNSISNPAVTNLATGQLPGDDLNKTTWNSRTDFRNAVTAGGLTFGLIKDSVAVFIRALENVTDTTVLANPKLLVLNKQRGEVIVGRRDGYLTTTVTDTAAIQNVEFLETGTQLRFRPFIGDDGYVRMEVHPEDSDGQLTADNLPFEQTTEVTTNVLVRDGHTILIGGLFRDQGGAAKSQLPLLGDIPGAGTLFRSSNDSTRRQEVIILLTVKIVKEDDAAQEASLAAAEDIERYRVGVRQGMQWFGRERLAQAHYHWALEHLAKGHLTRALWDLDLAINNNPKLLAAIRLKEDLLDKREWDDEGSSVRGFLSRQIMKEEGQLVPSFDRPGPPFEFPALQGPSGFEGEGRRMK